MNLELETQNSKLMFIQYLDFSFSETELILFGLFSLVFLHQIYFYWRYIGGVLRCRRKTNKGKLSFSNATPPVSVIICARNEEKNLLTNLPVILEQNYPDFEVIVVNDSSTDDTEFVLDCFKEKYPHLCTTFVPIGTKNLSTKKLGLTLAIKAAKYDLLLFTDADCVPADGQWISRMTRNFLADTEIVLGYGAYKEENTLLNRLIAYDTLFIGLQYMGMALAGKPYMGVGRNMAYTKEMFMRQNGFTSSAHLISGDDDLLVNKASDKHNTRVEVSPESITLSEPNRRYSKWFYQKLRHLSVSNNYNNKSKLQLVVEPITRGLFYGLFICLLSAGDIVIIGAAALLFIVRLIVQLLTINKSSKHFGGRKYITLLPIFDIFLPLLTAYILLMKKPFSEKGKITKWEL